MCVYTVKSIDHCIFTLRPVTLAGLSALCLICNSPSRQLGTVDGCSPPPCTNILPTAVIAIYSAYLFVMLMYVSGPHYTKG